MSDDAISDFSEFYDGGPVGVLLIHGLGGRPKETRVVALALARAGYTVYAMQLAGHCATPEELKRSTWRDWCDSVAAAHARLAERCDRVIAGGLSMGAVLALWLAQTRGEQIAGTLLLAPSFRLDGFAMPWYGALLRLVRPGFPGLDFDLAEREPHGLKDPRVRALVVRKMRNGSVAEVGVYTTPLKSFGEFNVLAARVRRRLAQVTQPALLVHPRQDDIASVDNALMLQRRLGGAVTTVILEESYHLVTVDRQRHDVATAVVQFCDRIREAGPPASVRRNGDDRVGSEPEPA